MGDWADEKAREWLTWLGEQRVTLYHNPAIDPTESLAALLREVALCYSCDKAQTGICRSCVKEARKDWLAEVRVVVSEVRAEGRVYPAGTDVEYVVVESVAGCCDEILSRLEALK